ncbi:myelin and lymphocyte protein-like [Tachysurus fulvidraco]|uniref:myelin and lymphocyte protein-like n=1 Tax=Tachysurus fulvidraco TaxID=1234273 RepID=UPI000F50CEB4|nr:myelin and lymphocyte protein-like [Tachysurus fulvidraco]
MASSVSNNGLPSGCKIFTTIPDIFFIPEFIFGGLTWCLVASTRVDPPNPLGWVMFVSIFCFIFTTLWFIIFLAGGNQSSVWPGLDVGYHFIAVLFYLSSSVALAYVTLFYKSLLTNLDTISPITGLTDEYLKIYREDIAAVVMSFITMLLYFIHAIFSTLRWKSS